jgi:23S rRNA (cytosine1962-C5)-methyltransferase
MTQSNNKYQVICCDPPAFAKSIKQIDSAKKGYAKLLELVTNIMDDQCYLFLGSCTHYVNIIELGEIVQTQARKKMIDLHLLDIGTQAPDHTNSGLTDRSNYIKYLSYYCKRG